MRNGRRAQGATEYLAIITAGAALLGCGVGTDAGDDIVGSAAAALPTGWTGTDINDPQNPTPPAGSSDAVTNLPNPTVFTLTSSARGIAVQHNNFTQGDNVHFVAQSYTPPGDFDVKVRLKSLSGSVSGQAGLMLRQSNSPNAFNVVAYLRKNAIQADAPDIPDMNLMGHTFRNRWAPGTSELDEGAVDIYAASRMDPGPDPNGAQDPPASFYRDIWFRIQRSGNDYAVARSANNIDWVPLHNTSGGIYPLTGAVQVGIFVAAGSPTSGPTSATAQFDNFEITAGPRALRTSWVGSSYDQASTGFVSSALTSFFVSPDGGRVYKHGPGQEWGWVAQILNGANGRVLSEPRHGDGVDHAALTGDGTSIYFARKERIEQVVNGKIEKVLNGKYCIDRMNPDMTTVTVTACAPDVTRVGGMALGRDANGVAALFVSELGPPPESGLPPPTSGTIRVFRADTLAPAVPASFSTSTLRPGPMAVDNNFNLWVIHTAVGYPIVANYDTAFAPAVKRYTASGTTFQPTGELTGALLPQNPVALAIDRRAGRDRMFIADNGSAQNVRVYRGLAGTPSADTTYNASARFGQTGGIYSATSRGMMNASGNNRLYALSGLAIDSAGALYVALNAPYIDIRKYAPSGSAHATTSAWTTQGVMNFSNLIDFDEATNGEDAYSARNHFTLNLASTTPGAPILRSMTWDPVPPAPLAYREKDEHGFTRRRSGTPRIKTIGQEKFLFVLSDADPDPDGPTGYRGARGGVLIYRFSGEIAIPWAAIRQEQHCGLSDAAKTACAMDPTCPCNIDPTPLPIPPENPPADAGTLDPYEVLSIWIDTDRNGVEDPGEVESTLNPAGMMLDGCETRGDCPIFESSTRNPSQAMVADPPPRGGVKDFDVDSNGDIWFAHGNDGAGSTAIVQLKRLGDTIPIGHGPRYSKALGTGRVQHPKPPEMNSVAWIRFQRATGTMFLMGGDTANRLVINRYDNWLTGTRVLRATATLPHPAQNVDVNAASNDFMFMVDPPYKRSPCGPPPLPPTGTGCEGWSTGREFNWHAFDVAGDKIFLAEKWGPIHVFDGLTGLPVTTLFAGPEESGSQSWNDSTMGIRAFRRSNGEYLIAAMDSSPHARTLLLRWTPPPVTGCTSDTQCPAGQFCSAGACAVRPCNLADPFASMAPVLPGVNADGFTLSANRQTAFVSTANDIHTATRPSPTAAFGPLMSLGTPVNSGAVEFAPWLSEDGLRLYYATTGIGGGELVMASRSGIGVPFTTAPGVVPGTSNPAADEDPFLMPGEQTLYFTSTRGGNGRDIYVATKSGSTFTGIAPVSPVNALQDDDFRPMLTRDGLTMFFGSRRVSPAGDSDGEIWVAQRTTPTGTFMPPTPLTVLNTSGIDFPVSLSADGCTLTLASNRETGLSGTQIYRLYQATRAATLSTVTVTMTVSGNGRVVDGPFNCGPGTPGTCTAQRPFGTPLRVNASGPALWSGACQANGTPGFSTDANIDFVLGGACTVTFSTM
jgi:Cys-rich repeat protein